MTSSIIDPNSVTSECLFVVKSHQHPLADKLHVIDETFLSEGVHQSQLLLFCSLHKLVNKNIVGAADTEDVIILKMSITGIMNGEDSSLSDFYVRNFGLQEFIRFDNLVDCFNFGFISSY